MSDYDELLSPRQTAAALRVCTKTLANMRSRGEGPHHVRLIGNRIYYRQADVRAWINSKFEMKAAA